MFSYGRIILKVMVIATIIIILGLIKNPAVFSKEITIKIGSYDTPLELTLEKTNGEFASTNIKCQVFKRIVEDRSKGRIKVKIYPAGQLGGDREAMEMTKKGSFEMSGYPGVSLSGFVPEVMAVQIPYMFKDINVANKVMNGPHGRELDELIVKKMGVRVLQWGFEGPYYEFMTVNKPVHVPSDLKGLKIRVQESPNMVAACKFAGAAPTPITWPEVYTSLQQRVVDGMTTCLPYVRMIKADELLKYITVASYTLGWSNIYINEKFYQSLSPEDKYLIKNAAQQAMLTFNGLTLWGEGLWVDYFRKKGIEVYFPTVSEMEEWVKAIKPPMIKWTKDKIGSELVEKYLKASEEVERKLYSD